MKKSNGKSLRKQLLELPYLKFLGSFPWNREWMKLRISRRVLIHYSTTSNSQTLKFHHENSENLYFSLYKFYERNFLPAHILYKNAQTWHFFFLQQNAQGKRLRSSQEEGDLYLVNFVGSSLYQLHFNGVPSSSKPGMPFQAWLLKNFFIAASPISKSSIEYRAPEVRDSLLRVLRFTEAFASAIWRSVGKHRSFQIRDTKT